MFDNILTGYIFNFSIMSASNKIASTCFRLKLQHCRFKTIAGRESYGRRYYEPNRIMVLVREELDEEAIKSPFTSLLTENVVNVSMIATYRL